MLRRRRQQRVALAAETAIKLGLREQRADFRLAAGGEQCQPVERAGERAAFDEIGAALAEPAGQLQQWVVIGAHEAGQCRADPLDASNATIASGPNLLARGSSAWSISIGPSAA